MLAIIGGAGAVFAALAWRDIRSVQTKLTLVSQNLQRVVDEPGALATPERRVATRAQFDAAVVAVDAARQKVSRSPALGATRFVPLLSRQRSGLVGLLDDAGTAAVTGRDLLVRVETLNQTAELRDGAVPFDGLRQLDGDLDVAARRFETVDGSASGLWWSLGDARKKLNEVAQRSASRLAQGRETLAAAEAFMGGGGDRRHLVAVQNNAEMRDQGMVLSYAVASFTDGRLSIERNGSVQDLSLEQPAPTPIPPESEQIFGFLQPNRVWQSVNATADFAWSGQAMADMYFQATGEPVDGVIAVDIPGLAAMLRVVGPVEVPGISEPMTAENAGRILLHDLYQGLAPTSDQAPRRERLSEATRAVVDRLTSGGHDVVALARELGGAAGGGHLRLWSSVAGEEEVFERTGLGGGPAASEADRTFHLAVQNRTATKLDYYVKPAVRQEIELTKAGSAVVRTTVVVQNQAPPGSQPSYQLGPDQFTQAPGDYLAWVLLWGPEGSTQRAGSPESGLVLSQQSAYLEAGQSRELTFETVIPEAVRDGRLSLRLVPQPRLEPVGLEMHLNAPGWQVDGPTTMRTQWDRVVHASWPVSR